VTIPLHSRTVGMRRVNRRAKCCMVGEVLSPKGICGTTSPLSLNLPEAHTSFPVSQPSPSTLLWSSATMSDSGHATQTSHCNAAGRRLDEIDKWRDEIEERIHNGETCKQIADALAAKGVAVSSKTISRCRVDWGLRKRVIRLGYSPERTPSHRPWVPR